ncbi:MAG: hypothetical protein PUG75_04240 [Prevotella sp.]|nr:hypothetical protein [Prevotella sp.]MDY5258846.1 hypothetical protein [Prevotella sp.]
MQSQFSKGKKGRGASAQPQPITTKPNLLHRDDVEHYAREYQ